MTSYLLGEGFHRGDVDAATFGVVQQHPQNSKLGTDGLSAAGGSAHEHIIITVVHSVEHWRDRKNPTESDNVTWNQKWKHPRGEAVCTLCLNGVEEGELVLVESLEGGVPEGGDGQRLQVQQLGRRGVFLR